MRTTVSLDDELLHEAKLALGTTGVSDTVNAALAATVRQAKLASFDVRVFDVTEDDVLEVRAERSASSACPSK